MVFRSKIYEYVNTRQDPHCAIQCWLDCLMSPPAQIVDGGPLSLALSSTPTQPASSWSTWIQRLTFRMKHKRYARETTISASKGRDRGKLPGTCEGKVAGRKRKTCCRRYYRYYTVKRGGERSPPLHVVFGLEHLYELINAALSQQERLGRLALRTFSQREAERGQLLDIARKFAAELQCQVDAEIVSGEYTVWLYGSRRQIGAIMRELTPQG